MGDVVMINVELTQTHPNYCLTHQPFYVEVFPVNISEDTK